MSQTTHDGASSSETLTSRGFKSGMRNLWSHLRNHISLTGAVLSVLSALYITAVTGGSTSHAIEALEAGQANVVAGQANVMMRLGKIEASNDQIAILTQSVVDLASKQGALLGTVTTMNGNISLLLEAALREQRSVPLLRAPGP